MKILDPASCRRPQAARADFHRLRPASPRLLFFCLIACALAAPGFSQEKRPSAADSDDHLVIAQISDTHIGLARAPDATRNLRWAVEQLNHHCPDAVIVTGDIGERPSAWLEARQIFSGLRCKPVFYIPGNHDDTADNVSRWRDYWGADYFEAHVKWVTLFGLDSQLLGNFDNYNAHSPQPLSARGAQESRKMLDWFAQEIADEKAERAAQHERQVFLVMQHVPISRANGGRFPNDRKPYWALQEPYRSEELELLHRLGVRDVLEGHWHIGMVFEADGITYHVAPATSWSPFSDKLGYALHTISRDGSVKTDFVYIPGADPQR